MDKIEIKTRDGLCPSYVFRPEGKGPWPGVLFFMDGPGIRPAVFEMGERLADNGYLVLMPDLFYRSGPYEPTDPKAVFGDLEKRTAFIAKHFGPANASNVMSDAGYFLDWLDASPEVKKGGVGITGYCMGGRLALYAAGTYGERIAAMASYHGGNLATDQPDSPHLLAPKIKAKVYVGGAIEDQSFPDEQKQRLEQALTQAGVDHAIETYPARHGWVPSDTGAYDPASSERHWETLLTLYAATLK